VKPLNDNEIAALVNALRDTAVQYAGTQQLRDRISRLVNDALGNQTPRPPGFEAFMTAEYGKSFARASYSAEAMRTCWMTAIAAVSITPPHSTKIATE
jgi:hypothetical protein